MMAEAIAQDPSQLWRSIWDPVADDWNNGNYGEAIGRVGFEVVNAIFGGKGVTKATRLFKFAPNFCSFTGDTRVLMADGTTKPIAEVKPGDQVWATDPETGEEGPRNVTAVWVHNDIVVDLELNGGTTTITTTEDHPFWNHTDQQWQPASALNAGDELLTPAGTIITVAGLDWSTGRFAAAYNLSVADINTYYVDAHDAPVLVHNCPGPVSLDLNRLYTHILPRHGPGSPATGTKFNEAIDPSEYESIANAAVRGAPTPTVVDEVRGTHAHDFDFGPGRVVGENGETGVRVWVDSSGNVTTMHPR